MQLLALAGGNPLPDGFLCFCCFEFLLLPLVAALAVETVRRNAVRPAVMALVLAGLPCLALWVSVAGHQPSDDWEVTEVQETEYKLGMLYSLLVATAGLSLGVVIRRRWLRSEPARTSEQWRLGGPSAAPGWWWRWWWLWAWLVVLAAVLALMVIRAG